MNFTRTEMAGMASSFALVVLSAVFSLGQGLGVAHADVDGGAINSGVYNRLCEDGMIFFGGCVAENPGDTSSTPTDPCDLPGMSANPECSGDNTDPNPDPCDIFDQMGNLPPNCENGNGGGGDGGGGGGGGGTTAACADGVDNDNDGLVDSADPDCVDAADTDEASSGSGGGGGGGGGGGSVMPQCRDSYDNDLDGLVDANDPDCADSEDNDESTSTSSGGGGGGGGGGYLSTATTTATSTGSVLGSSTTTPATCDAYLTAFIKQGNTNDEAQVKRLQYVLKNFESAAVDENGIYDSATLAAVHAFQTKYAAEILSPWNIAKSTGYVYLTTRKKVNEIYCKQQVTFPLSTEENKLIEATKATPVAPVVAKPKPAVSPSTSTGGTKKPGDTAKPGTTTSTSTDAEKSPVSRPWGSVGDFLRRLFNR